MDYTVAEDVECAEDLLKRGDLSHAEIADTLYYLRQQGAAPSTLSKISGLRDYTVRHYIRLSKNLNGAVKSLLHRNKISYSLARSIASLPEEIQEDEARKAIMYGTSVHRLRDKLSKDEQFIDEETARYFERLAELIAQQTGFSLSITPDRESKHAGTLSFRYTDLREFDSICNRLDVDLSEV